MTEHQNPISWVVERALTDQDFRKRLLSNPKATLEKELAIVFPKDLEVSIIEETANRKTIVLPYAGDGELEGEVLARVSGGLYSPGMFDGPAPIINVCWLPPSPLGVQPVPYPVQKTVVSDPIYKKPV